jgi:hypothetical protein
MLNLKKESPTVFKKHPLPISKKRWWKNGGGQKGIALYVALVVMALLLSIGLGLTVIIIGQLKIMKNMGDSVIAFQAADTGIEHALYNKRIERESGYFSVPINLDANTSYVVNGDTDYGTWQSVGTYNGVQRSIEITIPACQERIGGDCVGLSIGDCTNCFQAGCQWDGSACSNGPLDCLGVSNRGDCVSCLQCGGWAF